MFETAGKNRRGQRVIRTVLLERWMDTAEGSKGLSGPIPPSQLSPEEGVHNSGGRKEHTKCS